MALRKKAAATAAAETTAAPAAQEAEKKPAAKTRKAPAKRTPAAKKTAAPQVSLTLQYMGKELSQEDMVAAVKAQWTGEEIKTLALYVKPEDQAVYYVVNGEGSEDFPAAVRRESISIPSPMAGAVGQAYQNFFFLQIQRLRITIPTLTAIAAG